MTLEVFEKKICNGWLVMWVHDWPFVQRTGVQISLEPNFFFLIWIIIFRRKLFFTSLWYSKPILYYSLFKFFMSSWQYLESKDILGLRRVRELHTGKMRPFLFIISVAPSLGPLICLKSPFFNFRSAKLPSLLQASVAPVNPENLLLRDTSACLINILRSIRGKQEECSFRNYLIPVVKEWTLFFVLSKLE